MYRYTLKIVVYLIFSLLVGIAVTMISDKIENVTVERKIRKTLESSINQSLSSFRESAASNSAADEKAFIKKFAATVMRDKVVLYEHGSRASETADSTLFLFTLHGAGPDLDFYVRDDYLKYELSTLDVVDYISGIAATILIFTSIVLYGENKRRTLQMQHEFSVKQAELTSALKQHEALTLLGRMSATLAHELKTPIATISNLVQTFPSRQTDPQFVNRFLALMHQELNRTQQLIDNLLAYGKEIDIRNNEWIALEPVLRKCCSNGIRLEMPEQVTLFGDRFFLDLLFKNLVRNSEDAGAGTIIVHSRIPDPEEDSFAAIVLEDNGAGFPPAADLEKLAEPFVTSRSRGGGLGLYLARKIAVAHGGTLSLERMKQGARVIVSLPMNRMRSSQNA